MAARPDQRSNHVGRGKYRAAAVLALLWTAACAMPALAQTPAPKKPAATVSSPGQTPGQPPAPAAVGAPATPAASGDPDCTDTDLIGTGMATAIGVEGRPRLIQDGVLPMEGTDWNAPSALKLTDVRSQVVIDLHQPKAIRYLALQGDNNDTYLVDGSDDGRSYRPLWTAPIAEGMGLRTRFIALPAAQTVRYIRLRAGGGDNYYTVSELRAFCKSPKLWPLALTYPPKLHGWHAIDNPMMVTIKGWASLVGVLVLLASWFLRGRGKKLRIACDAALAIMGLFGFASWWNLGHYHFDHYVHIWEHYHYYMGAKYGPELRYSRLYECTAAADVQDGFRARVKKRHMRDLAVTNELGSTDAILADPTICTSHFTPERWKDFREDNRFFRSRFSLDRWDESQTDHGYNGTPVWAIAGRLIADYGPATEKKIDYVAGIDSGILVLMWAIALWAFGWRPVCVALLWWGFDFPARFYWNGGSFLRYDWLFWLVVGICLLKKRHHFGAGMALTYATLLRIFPGFVVAALVLKAIARIVRHRRLVVSRAHLWFAAGCIVAMAVLLPAAAWATGGYNAWPEFAQNSKKHLHTALTNNMGLKTVLGYDPPTSAKYMRDSTLSDPFSDWKAARNYFYDKRAPIYYALIFIFCIMLARAGDREPDWAAACYGTGLIAMSSELTCYYYGFLLTYGLLWERRKLPGVAITLLSAITCFLPDRLGWNDDHFTAMSLATSIVVILMTAWAGFGPRVRTLPVDEPKKPATPTKPATAAVSAESPFGFDT